jgi:hypothetical protein
LEAGQGCGCARTEAVCRNLRALEPFVRVAATFSCVSFWGRAAGVLI